MHHVELLHAFERQVPPYPNRACAGLSGYVHKAYEEATLSSGMIFEMYHALENQQKYVNEIGINKGGEVAAKGVALGLEASLWVIEWQKDWLDIQWYERPVSMDPDTYASFIRDMKMIVVSPATTGLKEVSYRLMQGDWRGADQAIQSLWNWAAQLGLHDVDLLALKYKLKAQDLYKNHVFKKLYKLANLIGELRKWHADVTNSFSNEDKGVLAALGEWWRLYNGYSRAVDQHRRNLADLQAKAEQCLQEHNGVKFVPPPAPAGLRRLHAAQVNGRGPEDPNEKVGIGFGPQGFIAPDTEILYTVRFENIPAATAAAQQVFVTDRLDDNLDLASVELVSIGFNGVTLAVPPGLDHFEETAEVTTDPNPVRVRAALDPKTRVATWVMESVDPVTGGLPEDPLAGFLPPNDAAHRGEGFVAFTARPLARLSDGAVMRNQARIVFDVNAPIDTNVVTNTIDATPPVSSVKPLPASSPPDFIVDWSGSDAGGSGIAFYDIYASTDGGSFQLWQPATTAAQAVFHGQVGHTYAFYGVATDNVGHRPPVLPEVQAMTTVSQQMSTYLPLILRR
jgi:hypothetical protein